MRQVDILHTVQRTETNNTDAETYKTITDRQNLNCNFGIYCNLLTFSSVVKLISQTYYF
jgi:hypothetical protein